MSRLCLYFVLAVVVSLAAFPQSTYATPYNCTGCMYQPFNIRNSLYPYELARGWVPLVITEDPLYPLSDNNEAAWDAAVWDEVANGTEKLSWAFVSNPLAHDAGYETWVARNTYLNYLELQDVTVPGIEVGLSEMEGDMAGKMDIPTGTTSQYMRGDGSLATFPTVPEAQVNSDWNAGSGLAQILNKPSLSAVATSGAYNDLSGKPSLGTSAALNVAAAGNAASGEVVKGSDTRLTDSRTPSAHVHATADVTSGTFADARIAQSNVTQHQAALSIGASQVTGTKTSAFTSDFAEAAQDNVLGVVTAGPGLSYTYDDSGNAASINLASKTYQSPTFNSATAATRLSTTKEADVFYAFDATVTISLLAGQSVTATLKYADDSGMSTNLVTVDSAATSNSGVLGLTQANTLRVGGKIPANKYRQVTFAVTGSGAAAPTTIKAGQEAF